MEKDYNLWNMSQLIKFARAFLKVPGLWSVSWFHKGRPPLDFLRHGVSLKILADELGEPVDLHYIEKCVYDFIANMLLQVRAVVQKSRSRDQSPLTMLNSLPQCLRRIANSYDLLDVAYLIETGECLPQRADSAKVKSFATNLIKAVQNAVTEMILRNQSIKKEAGTTNPTQTSNCHILDFLQSTEAVSEFAEEMDTDIHILHQLWLGIYKKTRSKLCQMREPVLSLVEWRVADLILLYEPELPLVMQESRLTCPERLLEYIVCLVAAATTRLPRPSGDDPVFGTRPLQISEENVKSEKSEFQQWICSVWTAVHTAYCKNEAPVSSVFLQRRWYEVRCATHAAIRRRVESEAGTRPLPALLFAVAKRFPNTAAVAPPSWPSLVECGNVVDLSTVGCQNPHLLCLLDDIGRGLNLNIIKQKRIFELEKIDNLSLEIPSVSDHEVILDQGTEGSHQEDTMQQLQNIDPSRAEVSILVEPHSDPENPSPVSPKAEKPASDTPAQVEKEDSLSIIIKQALNCRSIVRLKAPRLQELTDDILKKNCILAEKTDRRRASTDSSEDEDHLVIDEREPDLEKNVPSSKVKTKKRQRSDSGESIVKELADSIRMRVDDDIKKVKREMESDIRDDDIYVEDEKPVEMEPCNLQPELSKKLTLNTRVVLERVDKTSEPDADKVGLPVRPFELSRLYGVSEQTEAWWARNLPVAELCRPLRVRVCRLPQRSVPRVALPDIETIREINKTILTAEVAPTCVRPQKTPIQALSQLDSFLDELAVKDPTCSPLFPPSEGPAMCDNPERKCFDYLYNDMVKMMAYNAKRYLPNISKQQTSNSDSKTVPRRQTAPVVNSEAPQLSDLEKWEQEKRIGLQYFALPNLRQPVLRDKPENHYSNSMENCDPPNNQISVKLEKPRTGTIVRLASIEPHSDAVIETPRTNLATKEDARALCAQIRQGLKKHLRVPSTPGSGADQDSSTLERSESTPLTIEISYAENMKTAVQSPDCIVVESESDDSEEQPVSSQLNKESGILDDELRDLMRTDTSGFTLMNGGKGLFKRDKRKVTSEPVTPTVELEGGKTQGEGQADVSQTDLYKVQAIKRPGDKSSVFEVGNHSITLIEDVRHTAAEKKREINRLEKEKRIKVSISSIIEELKKEEETKKVLHDYSNASCYFKLPTSRHVTAAHYAAIGGDKTALMRADLRRPLWLVSKQFLVLTRAPLPFSRPSYWSTLHSNRLSSLTRVLFPGDNPDEGNQSVIDLTDEESEVPELHKVLGDPLTIVLVYNMVQDFSTFRRLISERQNLFLFSLATGNLGNLKLADSLIPRPTSVPRAPFLYVTKTLPPPLFPLPTISTQVSRTNPVISSVISIPQIQNVPTSLGNSNVPQLVPSTQSVVKSFGKSPPVSAGVETSLVNSVTSPLVSTSCDKIKCPSPVPEQIVPTSSNSKCAA